MKKQLGFAVLIIFVCVQLASAPAQAAISTEVLKQFASIYPQLFSSAFAPVAYQPKQNNPQQVFHQLLASYREQTSYEDLSLALETSCVNVLKSDIEIEQMMAGIGLSKADYDLIMYQLAENPAILKQFVGYLQANQMGAKLLMLQRELPTYGQLLPTKEHRKVFFEITELLKPEGAKPSQQFNMVPVTKPVGYNMPVKQPFSSAVWFVDLRS